MARSSAAVGCGGVGRQLCLRSADASRRSRGDVLFDSSGDLFAVAAATKYFADRYRLHVVLADRILERTAGNTLGGGPDQPRAGDLAPLAGDGIMLRTASGLGPQSGQI